MTHHTSANRFIPSIEALDERTALSVLGGLPAAVVLPTLGEWQTPAGELRIDFSADAARVRLALGFNAGGPPVAADVVRQMFPEGLPSSGQPAHWARANLGARSNALPAILPSPIRLLPESPRSVSIPGDALQATANGQLLNRNEETLSQAIPFGNLTAEPEWATPPSPLSWVFRSQTDSSAPQEPWDFAADPGPAGLAAGMRLLEAGETPVRAAASTPETPPGEASSHARGVDSIQPVALAPRPEDSLSRSDLLDGAAALDLAALDQALRDLLDHLQRVGEDLAAAIHASPVLSWLVAGVGASVALVMLRRQQRGTTGEPALPPYACWEPQWQPPA